MRLDLPTSDRDISVEMGEKFFSIGDERMIFDILRSKMYSNPTLAICREISCNARDAHREIGKSDVPIHIYVPNAAEPFYKIKDFGPGIDPDRMENIFIKYGTSTKRDDNVQTGSFGLGCKSPFAYSDTFTIITNVNGIQYNYACFIDETKIGKLVLLSSSSTKEDNGTELIIPVKPADFHAFAEWTEFTCRHWDVKPIVKGCNVSWQTFTPSIQGDRWSICNTKNSWRAECKAIIDGIEYPLDVNIVRTYADTSILRSINGLLYLYFDTGELSLSANREQIYLDKATKAIISDRLACAFVELRKAIINKVGTASNLWEANVVFRQMTQQLFSNLEVLGTLSWNGLNLYSKNIRTNCNITRFSKGASVTLTTATAGFIRGTVDNNRISHSHQQVLDFDVNTLLLINDLPIKNPTARHLRKVFDVHSDIKHITVLCPTDSVTEEKLNELIHLDKMEPKRLSSYITANARKYTQPSSRLLLFKFDNISFKRISYATVEEDTKSKVLCKLYKGDDRKYVLLKNGKRVGSQDIKVLSNKYEEYSFYGVDQSVSDDRIDDDLSDFFDLEEFLEDQVFTDNIGKLIEIKIAKDNYYMVDSMALNYFKEYESGVIDSSSLFLRRLRLHKILKELNDADSSLVHIYELFRGSITDEMICDFRVKNPYFDVGVMEEAYFKEYPLLGCLNKYPTRHSGPEFVKIVCNYVNLLDNQNTLETHS